MLLTYEAIDSSGKRTHDSVEAGGVPEAVDQLRRRGLFVTKIRENREAAARRAAAGPVSDHVRLPLRSLALFTRQMAMLLRAGSGVVPALDAVARQMKAHHAGLVRRLIAELEDGTSLTEAMRKYPKTFDAVYCAIIAAGEASATLPQMFARLAEMVGKRRAIRNKILGALAYPSLLIALCVKILFILLFFVLPRFADMFKQLGVPTPAVTRLLLSTGDLLRHRWPWLLSGAIVLGGTAIWLGLSDRGRSWLREAQFYVPMLGRLRSRLIQAQILRTMGMLLESRVGVLETLALVRLSAWAKPFQRLFAAMDHAVTSGGQLSTAFAESELMEPYICQAVRTGEDSGNLGEAMTYCADVLDEGNTELLNVLAKLLEPAILITMGAVVGGVAISLFLPLFDLTSAMK